MPVDRDIASSYFSPVIDGGSVHVSLLPSKKSLSSGSRDFVAVDWFVLEEDDISDMGNHSLFLPGYCEASPGIFLCPERVLDVQHDSPPGEQMLNWNVWIDFICVGVPETKEDMVGCEGYSQGAPRIRGQLLILLMTR